MTIDELIAAEQIRRVFADYCHFFDDRDLDAWTNLFAPDAVLGLGRHEHVGHAAIRAWADATVTSIPEPSRHHIGNIAIDVDGPGEARAVSDYLLVTADRQIAAAGRYVDRLVAVDGTWRLADHRLSLLRPAK